MSWVTNLLLFISVPYPNTMSEDRKIVEVNQYFGESVTGLVSLDDPALPKGWYGGSKYLEANLYAGAFNHLNLQAFVDHIRGIDWYKPAFVQLIVKEQEQDLFRIINVIEAEAEHEAALYNDDVSR